MEAIDIGGENRGQGRERVRDSARCEACWVCLESRAGGHMPQALSAPHHSPPPAPTVDRPAKEIGCTDTQFSCLSLLKEASI